MKFIADLHIHSKYSRATSRDMDVENLNYWAKIKGIKVLGTGDFTHPLWLKELKEKLEPAETGLFKMKKRLGGARLNHGWLPQNGSSAREDSETRFLLSSEISCIYSKNGRTRKIHTVILAPDFRTVDKINGRLGWIGNLKSDGRPILGLDAKELAKIALDINENCLIIPAHIWTPHFSLFGSNSGFDSIKECFEDYARYIFAGETGLSSDPAMNWRWSELDNVALVSNSDAHSPHRIGREANALDTELSYQGIVSAIKSKDPARFMKTIEFFPEEGRYHYDGHRNCGVVMMPQEAKKNRNLCSKCQKTMTIGVYHRIDDLADRTEGQTPSKMIPFVRTIPLEEIIADAKGMGTATKTVQEAYKELIKKFSTEFQILFDAEREQIAKASSLEVAEAVARVRAGKVQIEPGYDGEYGKIKIFEDAERGNFNKQNTLF